MEKLYTLEEAAPLLGIKLTTLRNWIFRRKIDSVKIGDRRFIERGTIVAIRDAGRILALPTKASAAIAQLQAERKPVASVTAVKTAARRYS